MDEFSDIWQNQEVEEMKISIEELRTKAAKFQRSVRWRNLREQVACGVVAIWFAAKCFSIPGTIPRISFGLVVAGALYVAWHLHAFGSVRALPSDMGDMNCVEFHRRELEKQRDLLRGVWKWYLGPLAPGLALFAIWGIVVARPDIRWYPEAFAAGSAMLFWGVWWMNRRAARRLDGEIRQLGR